MTRVIAFFDCSSPWTYMAFERLRRMRAVHGFQITWKPILVGGVFNSVNDSVYRSRAAPVPVKAAYTAKDIADWARLLGLRINWKPSIFPVNAAKAMRGCIVASRAGLLEPYAEGVFKAYWSDDADISAGPTLAAICRGIGLRAGLHDRGIEAPDVKAELRANTDELIARGGFGTPTFFLHDTDMYFGNDRLPLLEAALTTDRPRSLSSSGVS